MGAFLVDVNLLIKDVIGLEQVKQQIAAVTANVPVGVGAAAGGAQVVSAQSVAAATANAAAVNQAAAANDALAKSSKNAGVAVASTADETKKGAKAAQTFGQQVGLAGRRYLAFLSATVAPFAALGALREAIGSVIEFDEAVTRVRQITGQTAEEISGLRQQFLDLSIATGTSATELAKASKTLVQAGVRGAALEEALVQLAKVPLTPTFGSIQSAIEGLLAVQNQFEDEALGVAEVFDVLTKVGNEFAATAEDLFQGFARGGAAFEAVGGTFREFAAVLAIVRQETRESATTVGTFFKTLSARLGDPKIQEFLRGKGIDLFGETGEFVGPIEAIRRIGNELENLDNVSDKVNIATKIAGRRQVSRFLALTSSIDKMNNALEISESAGGEFGRIAEEGLTTLRAQLDIVVAKFNELFQELAEPVFIPLIKGFTAAATGAASLISALSPVIPIFTQIVAAGIGIKALTLSVTALASAAKGLAAIRFAGLANLGATGVAATAGAGAAAAGTTAAAGGALAATTVGIATTGKALIKSQLGQVAALGITIGLLDHFSEEIKEAGGASAELSASFVKTIASLAIGASLLSGRSASQLAGSLFGSLSGSIVGLGALLGTALITAGRIANEAIQQNALRAAESIRGINVDIGDGIEQEVQSLGTSILESIRESANQFRDTETGEQSFTQFFQEAGKRLIDLVSGERGLADPTVNTAEVIDTALENASEKVDEIFTAAVTEFGLDFREGLIDSLAGIPGASREAAVAIADRIIANVDQATRVSALSQATAARREAAEQKVAKQAEDLAARLSKVSVPAQLSTQLDSLSEAVKRTVGSIDSNISAFDALINTVGNIQAPQVGFDISEKAVSAFLEDPNALGNLLGESFGDLSEQTRNLILFRESLEDLGKAFSASRADFESGVDFDDPQADPAQFATDFINRFVDQLGDIPPEVEGRLRAAGERVTRLFANSVIPEEDAFEAIEETFNGQLVKIGAQVSSDIETILEKAAEASEFGLTKLTARLNALSERVSLAGIADGFSLVINELKGFSDVSDINLNSGDLIGEINAVGTELVSSQEFFSRYGEAARRVAQATSDLTEAQSIAGANIPEARKQFEEAAGTFARFQFVAQQALKGVDQAIEDLDPTSFNVEQERLDLTELRGKIEDELSQIQLDEIFRATDLEGQQITFEGAVDLFGENVRNYALATDNLVAAIGISLTPGRVTRGKSTEAKVGEIISVSQPGIQDVRILNTGEIATALSTTQQDVVDLNRAAFGVDNIESLFEALQQRREATREVNERLGLRPLPEEEELKAAAKAIAEEQLKVARASGEFAGNLENLSKNIQDLLLGRLEQPGVAPAGLATIDPETRQELQVRSEFRVAEIDASAQSARAAAAEASASAERAAAVLAAIQVTGVGTDEKARADISFDERFASEIEALRQQLEKVPQQQVLDVETLGTLLQQQDVDGPVSALDPAQLESALTGAITASLSSTLPTLVQPIIEGTTGLEGDDRSVIDVSETASQLANAAQAVQETTAGIVAGGEALQVGTQQLASVSEGFSAGIAELAAVVDVQREAAKTSDTTEIASATNELAEINRESIEAVRQQNESLLGLTERLSERIAQAKNPEPIPIEDITIEGLEESNSVTEANSEALASSRDSADALGGELAKTQQALSEGLTAKVESVQTIRVDVRGLEDTVSEFSDEFEAVAEAVAKKQIRIALTELANTLGNPELSQNARSVADGLV